MMLNIKRYYSLCCVIMLCVLNSHPVSANAKVYKLYVDVAPANVRIFIMNIKQKFHQGIPLQVGRYDLLISHDDYYRFRQFIELEGHKTRTISNHHAIDHKHNYPAVSFQVTGSQKDEIRLRVVLHPLPSTIEQLKDITQRVLRQGTQEVQQFLNEYYKVNPLALDNAKKVDLNAFLKQAVTQLKRIAQLYQQIASRKDAILAVHQTQFNRLARLQQQTEEDIQAAEAEVAKYRKRNADQQAQLNRLTDDNEKRQLQLSIEMDANMAQTFELTQQAIKENAKLQAQLTVELKAHSDLLAHLLDTLTSKAKFTEQAANLLSVNRNTAGQLNKLADTNAIKEIIEQIGQSERTILALMTKIEEINLQ